MEPDSSEFDWRGHSYPLPLAALDEAAHIIDRASGSLVTAEDCLGAVGPLLEALSRCGWQFSPPAYCIRR